MRGLRRNLAVALGNSGDRHALEALDETAADATKADPLVIEHLQWATRRLSPPVSD